MPAIAPIQLVTLDPTNPTESKTWIFSPRGFTGADQSIYMETSGGIPVGFPRIMLTVKRGNATTDSKVSVQIDVPVLANTSPSTSTGVEPAAQRAYNPIFKGEFHLPRSSSRERRSDLLQLASKLLADTALVAAVEQLDPPY